MTNYKAAPALRATFDRNRRVFKVYAERPAAKTLGVTIPPSLLLRADEVIE